MTTPSTIALHMVMVTVILAGPLGCGRHEEDSRTGDEAAEGGKAQAQPLSPQSLPTALEVVTFEGFDPVNYAGNLDPIAPNSNDPQRTSAEDQLLRLINAHRASLKK